MAGWQSWDFNLDADRVLEAQGADPKSIRKRNPGLVAVAERALREGTGLINPKVSRRNLAVEGHYATGVRLSGGGCLAGANLEQQLRGADEVVIVVCTIGGALEQRASATLAGDPVLALAFDGLGTAAVDSLAAAVCSQVATEAEAKGSRATLPLSPGMMDWPLAEGQDALFSLVDAGEIGVTLTSSRFMVPRKSVSMVIGIGPQVVTGGRTCDACNMKETCRHRIRVQATQD